MNKPERLSLIASIAKRLGRGNVRPALNALPAEVSEEVNLAAVHNDDESILDVDVEVRTISPQLAAIVKPSGRAHRIKTDDGLLSEHEREQVRAERLAYRQDQLARKIEQDLLCAEAHAPYALIPYQAAS